MLRRQFIKHGLVASTFLTGSLAALVPSIAHAEKTGSFKYGSQTINIKVDWDGEKYTAFFNLNKDQYASRIYVKKGGADGFAGLGQKDGQILMIGDTKVTLYNGSMLVQGADGSVKKFETPPMKNVGPVVVIVIIIIIIHGKWPPKPKLVRFNDAAMAVGGF
jgi:hypothetical protein